MPAASRSDRTVPDGETMGLSVRPARDSDADGLIALVGGCFDEYPGCVLDVDGEIPELRAIATYATRRNGFFWIVERHGEIVACIGAMPTDCGAGIELVKLYVRADQRGQGLARDLIRRVEGFARSLDAGFIELWTDTRFVTAHAVYAACGYETHGQTRTLDDLSDTVEYRFEKRLTGER